MDDVDRFIRLCRDFAEQEAVERPPVERLHAAAARLQRRRRMVAGGAGIVAATVVMLAVVQLPSDLVELEVETGRVGDAGPHGTEVTHTTTSTTAAPSGRDAQPSTGPAPAAEAGNESIAGDRGPWTTGPGEGQGPEPEPSPPTTSSRPPLDSPHGWYGAEGCIATSENSRFEGGPYPPECTYVATRPGGYHASAFDDGPWEIRIERGDELIVYRSGEGDVCTYIPVIQAGDRVTATTLVESASSDRPADVSVGAAVSCSGRPAGDDPESDGGGSSDGQSSEPAQDGGSDGEGDDGHDQGDDRRYEERYRRYEEQYRPS